MWLLHFYDEYFLRKLSFNMVFDRFILNKKYNFENEYMTHDIKTQFSQKVFIVEKK